MDTNTKEIAFRLEKLEDKIDNLRFSRIDEITDQLERLEASFKTLQMYTVNRIDDVVREGLSSNFDPDDHDLYTKEEVCNVAMEEANDQFVALRKELPQLIEDKINEMKGASDAE